MSLTYRKFPVRYGVIAVDASIKATAIATPCRKTSEPSIGAAASAVHAGAVAGADVETTGARTAHGDNSWRRPVRHGQYLLHSLSSKS